MYQARCEGTARSNYSFPLSITLGHKRSTRRKIIYVKEQEEQAEKEEKEEKDQETQIEELPEKQNLKKKQKGKKNAKKENNENEEKEEQKKEKDLTKEKGFVRIAFKDNVMALAIHGTSEFYMFTTKNGTVEPVVEKVKWGYGEGRTEKIRVREKTQYEYCKGKIGVDQQCQKMKNCLPKMISFRFPLHFFLYTAASDLENMHQIHCDFCKKFKIKPMEHRDWMWRCGIVLMSWEDPENAIPKRWPSKLSVLKEYREYLDGEIKKEEELQERKRKHQKKEPNTEETQKKVKLSNENGHLHFLFQYSTRKDKNMVDGRSRCYYCKAAKTCYRCKQCDRAFCHYQKDCFAMANEHTIDNIDARFVPEEYIKKYFKRSRKN
jgi:hypothetical protein